MLVRRARSDALEQQQHAVPGDGVARVLDHAQVRQHVLDVRRLDELEAAALDERDVGARQLELEIEGVEARAEEHGDLRQRHALLAQLEDALADEARLVVLVRGRDQQRLRAAPAGG